jgi:hypothetical protein
MTLLYLIRLDSPERFDGIEIIFKYKAAHGLARDILAWEVDAKPYPGFAELCASVGARYEFHEDYDPFFHRTRWSNRMVMATHDEVIAICHADTLVPAGQVGQANDAILRGEKYVAAFEDEKGVTGFLLGNEKYVKHLQAGGDSGVICADDSMLCFPRLPKHGSYSGMVFLNRTFYIRAGLDDEAIVGWGPEEVERHDRLWAFGAGYRRIPGWAVHLSHPTAYHTRERIDANAKECARMRMPLGKLMQEVETWKTQRGY